MSPRVTPAFSAPDPSSRSQGRPLSCLLHLTDALLRNRLSMHFSLRAWRLPCAIRLSKAGTSRWEEKEKSASRLPGAGCQGRLEPPKAGLPLGGRGQAAGTLRGADGNLTNGSLSPRWDLGRPVSCHAHTPTGLRAVRLVPKANTELVFPAYSFHVWAAPGFAGSLGSLLPASLKPPAPSALLAPGVLSPLRPSPNTVFHFTWARRAPERLAFEMCESVRRSSWKSQITFLWVPGTCWPEEAESWFQDVSQSLLAHASLTCPTAGMV